MADTAPQRDQVCRWLSAAVQQCDNDSVSTVRDLIAADFRSFAATAACDNGSICAILGMNRRAFHTPSDSRRQIVTTERDYGLT